MIETERQERPRAVVLACAGAGGHGGDFDAWAGVWAARGIVTRALDLPGCGRRKDEPLGPAPGADGEVRAALAEARTAARGAPVIGVGESIGALILLHEAASNPESVFDGLVLAAPAFATPGKVPPGRAAKILIFSALGFRGPIDFTGPVDRLTADPARQKQIAEDPRRSRAFPARYLVATRRLQRTAMAAAARVRCPMLILWGEQDRVASFSEIRRLLALVPAGRRQLLVLPDERHQLTLGIRRLETAGAVANWMDERVIRPSRDA